MERDYRLIFSLSQSELDLILMQEIKNFFNNLAQQQTLVVIKAKVYLLAHINDM